MAYRESACTDMDQVPGLIASFAGSLGWAVENDGAARLLRRPGAGGTQFRVATVKSTVGSTNYEAVSVARVGLAAFATNLATELRYQYALLRSPWLSSAQRQPFIPKPSKLHCFGEGGANPFLAFVVEYGFNVYRCLYLGTLGAGLALGGGEVVSVSSGVTGMTQTWFDIGQSGWNGLFSGRYHSNEGTTGLSDSHGGIYIAGKDDAGVVGFSRFGFPDGNSDPSLAGVASPFRGVWGGPRDGPDDQLISAGFSPFSGNVILHAINLFTAVNSGTETRAAPLGHVVGARAVNMRDIEPGSLHEIGNKLWRCFPMLRKNFDAVTRAGEPDATGTGGNRYVYAREDTSWYWGVAFLQGDAA